MSDAHRELLAIYERDIASLRAELAAAQRERDDALSLKTEAMAQCFRAEYDLDKARAHIAELERERDEARAELSQLIGAIQAVRIKTGGGAHTLRAVTLQDAWNDLHNLVGLANALDAAQRDRDATLGALRDAKKAERSRSMPTSDAELRRRDETGTDVPCTRIEEWLADRAAVRALEHAIRDAETHGWDAGSILRVVGNWKDIRQRMRGWGGEP